MSEFGIIGGSSLQGCINIHCSEHEIIDDKINITADWIQLGDHGPTGPSKSDVETAIEVIEKDLKEKSEDINGFVSIRIHVGKIIWRLKNIDVIDALKSEKLKEIFYKEEYQDSFTIRPNEFILCQTLERMKLPGDVCAFIQTRTSISMMGLDVTPTNLIVPGFGPGSLFLEIKNNTDKKIEVQNYTSLAEMFFLKTTAYFDGNAKEYDQNLRALTSDYQSKQQGSHQLEIVHNGEYSLKTKNILNVFFDGLLIYLGFEIIPYIQKSVSNEHIRTAVTVLSILILIKLHIHFDSIFDILKKLVSLLLGRTKHKDR